jgi:hypothetical protein
MLMQEFILRRSKMDKTIVYRDTYRGVSWEVNHIERSYGNWFTYYIFLVKNLMLPEQFELFNCPLKSLGFAGKKRKFYDYNKVPDVFDFHGGCTYYEKDRDIPMERFMLKIGCDYNHYQDEARQYQLEDIISDVKKSIDSFLSQYEYKRWCGNCGAVVDLKDGVVKSPDDGTYAFKCLQCIKVKEDK